MTAACSIGGFEPSTLDLVPIVVTINVVDESGSPVEDAAFTEVDRTQHPADAGVIELWVTDPRAGLIEAPGYLSEPVVVDAAVGTIEVALWSEQGPDGTPRIAMHFAGDSMFGRRYLTSRDGRPPLISTGDGGASAAAVVEGVASVFSAADVSMVNLETVLGDAPMTEAATGKRFLLQSPQEATAALEALGVDVVVLGNNHSADWGDAGVRSTLEILADAELPAIGAGLDDEQARVPAIVSREGLEIGVLSYTTVTGSAANDALPTAELPEPRNLTVQNRWQYELRPIEDLTAAGVTPLPAGNYRAGDLWAWFEGLPAEAKADAGVWSELSDVFPELQDWVARRGHGGAAWFRRSAVRADVQALREDGVDLVVVQLHGGYQFSEVGSTFFMNGAHAAIDAGADLVIGHHPHVLQGFEWYEGRLIAHSLGNFVFDQDFLSTFSSMMLRVVYEGDRLLEARVFPVVISEYVPVFAAGDAARSILRELRADSTGIAPAEKIGGVVARNIDAAPAGSADLQVVGNSGRVVESLEDRQIEVEMDQRGIGQVPGDVVVLTGGMPEASAVGRELLRWGSFDDVIADQTQMGANNWKMDGARRTETVAVDSAEHDLALRLAPTRTQGALVRPLARVPVPRHRVFDSTGKWVDGEPEYALRASIKRSGPVVPEIRLDVYRFEDSDPLSDPESQLLRRIEVPLAVEDSDAWQQLETLVPPGTFDSIDGVEPNAVMVYLSLPSGSPTEVLINDLQLIEWRRTADLPDDLWIEADVIRSTADLVTMIVR